jgi:cellulose synthase/poly-beta-1,6-N-acetylglucosamine synthase-like glycosyltransferase
MSTPSPSFPEVSVIVPIYNGEKDIPDLIACLEKQTYPRDRVEYLLVDNNSSDRTAELLDELSDRARREGLPITVLSENKIQSSYAARNTAIRKARYSLLAFTDMDCRPIPEWLEELVKPFDKPEIGLVAGDIAALPGTTLLEKYADRHEFMAPKFLLQHSFCPYGQTANLAIRQEAFEKVGLFRPYLTTGGDADICWRIQRETGWKLVYAPEARIYHRHRATLKDFQSQLQRYGRSNRYLHELYGVELMRSFTAKDLVSGLTRWAIRDIPRNSLKIVLGKADFLDLITAPIELFGFYSRSRGQATAKLPDRAREIERL